MSTASARTNPTTGLADTQRRMQAAMTGQTPPVDAAFVHGTTRFPPHKRLALYRRGYRHRLIGCLRECYPAVSHALGGALFDDFADEYVAHHPPRSPNLADFGADFPTFLEATRPDAHLPPSRRESWPDFLVDLARLEREFREVYHAPGLESASRSARTGTVPPRVRAAPCLRLLSAHHPIDLYLLDVRRGANPHLPAQSNRWLALTRVDWIVRIHDIDREQYGRLSALREADMADPGALHAADPSIPEQQLASWLLMGLLTSDYREPARRPHT